MQAFALYHLNSRLSRGRFTKTLFWIRDIKQIAKQELRTTLQGAPAP